MAQLVGAAVSFTPGPVGVWQENGMGWDTQLDSKWLGQKGLVACTLALGLPRAPPAWS